MKDKAKGFVKALMPMEAPKADKPADMKKIHAGMEAGMKTGTPNARKFGKK